MNERTIPFPEGHCAVPHCAELLLDTLTQHHGIGAVALDAERRELRIRYDPATISRATVQQIADRVGVQLGERFHRCVFALNGVSCRGCGGAIEHRLRGREGIIWSSANPASRRLAVEYAGTPEQLPEITRAIDRAGVQVHGAVGTTGRAPQPEEEETWWQRYHLVVATTATLVFLVSGWLLGRLGLIPPAVQTGLYVLTYLAGGFYATRQAIASLLQRSVDIDLLMVLAALGAATIGGWVEGGMLLFLFSLGNTLEHYALDRTHRAVRALMELSPPDALVVRDGQEIHVPVEELIIGDTVIVKPGERIPIDGRVLAGESAVDQSPITGESLPVGKRPNDPVFAGTINGHGLLRIQVERLAQESTLAKIVRIVEEARSRKSRTQHFTDAFEGAYAIGVIVASALVVIIPVVFLGRDFHEMFYRAMTLLVVASPCALVISTPASILSALANGARRGILFKGAVHLENVGVVDTVAFDKTGTLTMGQPRVTDVITVDGVDTREMLLLAAAVERLSEHPLGNAVVEYAAALGIPALADEEVADLQSVPGRGVRAVVRGQVLRIGNEALLENEGLALPEALRAPADALREQGKTLMFVGTDRPLGVIAVADVIRPVAPAVIDALHRLGVKRTIILTGDNERAARAIARQVGIDEWRAGLLPEEKLATIRDLQRQGAMVAMVGDGVNDAPALATANIGIAMGAAGTDVALETADVVLMADDLTKLPYAIELSRTARRVIRQNLTFALGVIVVLVTATLLGEVPLPLGVVGHEGSTIIVVLNGLRLLRFAQPALATRTIDPHAAQVAAAD
ncbi:MAG: heavy metal translocating P-type ATPase [Sphaerobacter sp.]|nr:heavy metal translocating P-type ATPase [Sphaerobacter sp.]